MPSIREELQYTPVELSFGTSGLRGLVVDMTDLECYINAQGFLRFLTSVEDLRPGCTVYLAGDLRDSTPRILRAMHQAVVDAGFRAVNCGLIPTPALAYYALLKQGPCIMVTGSHIPADRNGIKFYKPGGEVLKDDEAPIKEAVSAIRSELYSQEMTKSIFDTSGSLKSPASLPPENPEAARIYVERYTAVFDHALDDMDIVFYQHSAVGRDSLPLILEALGANVARVGRSDVFVPIDTENVTPNDQAYFRQVAKDNPGAFAIVSTDGDSDRPFVIDADGEFHRGDVLGAVVADWLQADFTAYPVSASDAVDTFLDSKNISQVHTKIGSPYVIVAMQEGVRQGKDRVVGWEVNGGILLGSPMAVENGVLGSLPTRDALLPIIVALLSAKQSNKSVAELFAELPARATQAGLIDNFPPTVSQAIKEKFDHDSSEVRAELEKFFTPERGFGAVKSINSLDGVRISFENGDIAHLRPSSNAPQLRIYSVAGTQERADEIVALAIAEPDGIFRQIENSLV